MSRTLAVSTVANASKAVHGTPKLWNAKRRIDTSRKLPRDALERLRQNPYWSGWRELVSQDVVKFIDDTEGRDSTGHPLRAMHPDDKLQLLSNPVRWFSRPHNVPAERRPQILFPNFEVALRRSPHLGPYFAQFNVPLSFGKLDLKSYLKTVYNVDVTHVRSYVVYAKPVRDERRRRQGRLRAVAFKKKMTVQLVKPFQWPKELTAEELNGRQYTKDKYWEAEIAFYKENRAEQAPYKSEADTKHRATIAAQAKALLDGRRKWQPTWKQIASDARVVEGRHHRSIPLGATQSSEPESLLM